MNDCDPGAEVQVDFGRLMLLTEVEGRRRMVKGHVQIAKALYGIPGDLVGQRLTARVDTQTP